MLAATLALAAALARPHGYEPCAHPPHRPAPRSTSESRAATREEIRLAVAELGGSPSFATYLIAVAHRESTLRAGVIHTGDAAHADAAYRRLRRQHIAAGHPFARARDLWLSYGLFGQNSNYYADEVADPRELCTISGAIGAYASAGAKALRRMQRLCVAAPTWADLHRALQGGKLCPDGGFERIPPRLAAERVSPADLGRR